MIELAAGVPKVTGTEHAVVDVIDAARLLGPRVTEIFPAMTPDVVQACVAYQRKHPRAVAARELMVALDGLMARLPMIPGAAVGGPDEFVAQLRDEVVNFTRRLNEMLVDRKRVDGGIWFLAKGKSYEQSLQGGEIVGGHMRQAMMPPPMPKPGAVDADVGASNRA